MLGLLLVGALVVLMLAELAVHGSLTAQATLIGVTNGSVYALIALGYTLVYGILELINFAHGDVFMLGGMLVCLLYTSDAADEARPPGGDSGEDGGGRFGSHSPAEYPTRGTSFSTRRPSVLC